MIARFRALREKRARGAARNGERGDTFVHYGRQVRNGAFVTGYPPRTQDMGRNSLAAQPNILYLGALANCTSANDTWPTSGCCVEPLAEKCGQDGPAEMQLHPGLLHAGAELAYRETHYPKHKRQKFLVYANSNCVRCTVHVDSVDQERQ